MAAAAVVALAVAPPNAVAGYGYGTATVTSQELGGGGGGVNIYGADVQIESDVLWSTANHSCPADSEPGTGSGYCYILNDLWVEGNTFPSCTGSCIGNWYWVEAFEIAGGGSNPPFLMWCENEPTQYVCHGGPAASTGTWYEDKIEKDLSTSRTWDVNIGGFTGVTAANMQYAVDASTGTETDSRNTSSDCTEGSGTCNRACSNSAHLGWYDAAGGLHTPWSNATIDTSDNPPYAEWADPYKHVYEHEANPSCLPSTPPSAPSGAGPLAQLSAAGLVKRTSIIQAALLQALAQPR